MYFSYSMWVCMKAFGMSTVTTYVCYFASMIHVIRTDLVTTVGALESYLDIKSLWLFLPATVLNFRVPYIFSLRKLVGPMIVFLCSLVESFLFRGMNIYLIWSFFISDYTDHLPFFPHFLRYVLSKSLVMMTEVMSDSFCTAPGLNNTW